MALGLNPSSSIRDQTHTMIHMEKGRDHDASSTAFVKERHISRKHPSLVRYFSGTKRGLVMSYQDFRSLATLRTMSHRPTSLFTVSEVVVLFGLKEMLHEVFSRFDDVGLS